MVEMRSATYEATLETLDVCAKRFREYEVHHRAKPDHAKADRNRQMAELCEENIRTLKEEQE